MPRNVRPSFVNLSVEGRSPVATGPRSRTGTLSAMFSVRSDGSVLRLLDVHCLANGDTVRLVVVDLRTGREVFSEEFQQ
jgi:hypothetical protein